MLTVKEVAQRLRVSSGTIYAAIAEGRLIAHRFGRGAAIRIAESNLDQFVESCADDAPSKPQGYRHLKVK